MSYLIDTNIISEAMRPIPHEGVRQWLNKQFPIFISVITVEEIYYGLSYKEAIKQQQWFEKLLNNYCHVLPIDGEISKECGILRGKLRQQGIIKHQADLLIAATAKIHHLTLVTRNVRDFSFCDIPIFNPFTN